MHILWAILAIELDSMATLLSSSETIFRFFFKEGQEKIVNFGIDKFGLKCVYLDLFWLRNLMVSSVFRATSRRLRNHKLKKLCHKLV